jgi:FixJ family two-component response regulator
MTRQGLHASLRSAIRQAFQTHARGVVDGGRANLADEAIPFRIDLLPVQRDGKALLLLVCFVDEPYAPAEDRLMSPPDLASVPDEDVPAEPPAHATNPDHAFARAGTNPHTQDAPVHAADAPCEPTTPVIFVVDDDPHIREAIRTLLREEGHLVEDYDSCETFLEAYHAGRDACLLVDAYLPGMPGLELLQRLRIADHHLPAIMITGNSDVHMAVEAMKAGASDLLEKPINREELLASIARALEQSRDANKLSAARDDAAHRIAALTPRQREIMHLILAGQPSKNIAADLGVSRRTVENHRAAIMHKTGSKSLPALARLALLSS